ncbi:MAG: hypothetical protein F6K56_32840, partial [Moorea sp. SIO3G5]|nr:hypothetical protein [Moorena sp. SIO3G5]
EDSVVLARLAINRSGVVTPDFSVRQYSGVRLPSGNSSNGEITGPILRSGGSSDSSLVVIDGDLSVSGNGNSYFAGSLGIGITEPHKKLHVERGELRVRASHHKADADIGTFYADNLTQGIGIGFNRIEAIGSNTDQDIYLIPKGNGELIVYGGNLTVSAGKIQLDGHQQIVFTDKGTTNNLKLQLWDGYGLGINGGTLFYATATKHSWRDGNGTNERMALTTAANGGLTVKGTGKSSFAGSLGIGTTDPGSSKLKVQGNLTVTGNATLESLTLNDNFSLGGSQTLSFGSQTRQMINLWNQDYGIGIQHTTQYFRTARNFAWYKDGSHNDGALNAGGGTVQMVIKDGKVGIGENDPQTKLDVNGDIRLRGQDIQDAGGTNRITVNDNGTLELKDKDGTTALTINNEGKIKLKNNNSASVNEFSTDGTLSGASNFAVPTEQAVKSYVDSYVDGKFVRGMIMMWSGTTNNIPSGWALCNGSNGTPNLTNRFIVGAGDQYVVGKTGGENMVRLTIDQMPSHNHSNGSYNRLLKHDRESTATITDYNTGSEPNLYSSRIIQYAGGNQAHENRPLYYALTFIMKL